MARSWRGSWWRAQGLGLASVVLVALAGCGGGGRNDLADATPGDAGTEPASETSVAAYRDVLSAIEGANVPFCPTEDALGFVALPAPAAAAAADYSYFRYLDGAIYEFGPCQLDPGQRNELRLYRYPDSTTRDTALADVSQRQTRPTSTFAYRDVLAIEIWSPEPALDSPVGQAAATVHSAIAEVPEARHLDEADGRRP